MTACLSLLDLATEERPFGSSRWGVEEEGSSSSRLRRERLVSLRPTEAGVPDRDSSSSSSDSTARDLRLGIEGMTESCCGAKKVGAVTKYFTDAGSAIRDRQESRNEPGWTPDVIYRS